MRRHRLFRKSLSLLVLFMLLLPTLPPPAPPRLAESAAQEAGALASAPEAATGLYRTRVSVATTAQRQRLEGLGVTVIERSDDRALVLADAEQLAVLC